VATGDFDEDGIVEMITVGCTYFSNLCDPDMRIWSVQGSSSSISVVSVAVALIILVAISIVILMIVKKKRRIQNL
jgi:hypothetical protein